MTPIKTWSRAIKVSSTDSGFAARIPTLTAPVNDGVNLIRNGEETLEIFFFGAGSDNTASDARIIGWSQTIEGVPLWIPDNLAEVTATRSAIIGVATGLAIATDRFADTLVVNKGIAVANTVTSDSGPAKLIVDITGFDRWELIVNITAGTNLNAIFRTY